MVVLRSKGSIAPYRHGYTCATLGIKLGDWLNEPSPLEMRAAFVRKKLSCHCISRCLPLAPREQTLNNDSAIKMFKMGFPEEMIVGQINRSPGIYDTSPAGLTALKAAGVGTKAVSAMVLKATATATPTPTALLRLRPPKTFYQPLLRQRWLRLKSSTNSRSGSATTTAGRLRAVSERATRVLTGPKPWQPMECNTRSIDRDEQGF
jgi:hypothetical protein